MELIKLLNRVKQEPVKATSANGVELAVNSTIFALFLTNLVDIDNYLLL